MNDREAADGDAEETPLDTPDFDDGHDSDESPEEALEEAVLDLLDTYHLDEILLMLALQVQRRHEEEVGVTEEDARADARVLRRAIGELTGNV